jgi:ribosomal protein S18 acetylase RimI-like enzyme
LAPKISSIPRNLIHKSSAQSGRRDMTSPRCTFKVRPCGLSDVASVSDLLRASWHAAHDRILGPDLATRVGRRLYSKFNLWMWIAYSISRPRSATMLVAHRGGDAIGLAMGQPDSEGAEIILYMLYVHPQSMRQGVGSALLRAVIARFPDARAIRLEVLKGNAAAIEWYEAKGFATYGDTEHATGTPGTPSLYMDKMLTPSR